LCIFLRKNAQRGCAAPQPAVYVLHQQGADDRIASRTGRKENTMDIILPLTNGTDKQIAYAEKLRAKVLPMLAAAETALGAKDVAKPYAAAAVAYIRNNVDARYWLDTYAHAGPIDIAFSQEVSRRFFVCAGLPADTIEEAVRQHWTKVVVAIDTAAK
jgi:hypothetical protein